MKESSFKLIESRMASRLLRSLGDDNPDLQKEIGCMTGMFQLFDRHHLISGSYISHEAIPSGTLCISYL